MIKCMEGHSDCPVAASSPRSSSLFQTVHCCHSTCNVAWIRAGESSKDHLRCLPIMWLDILSRSPITFALFTEKYPHDTSSKLSRHKWSPNPPALVLKEKESQEYSHTVAFLDEITDLNLELGQALRPALRLRSSAWKTLCWGFSGSLGRGHLTQFALQWLHRRWLCGGKGTTLPVLWFLCTLREILFDVSGSSISKKKPGHQKLHREMESQGLSFRKSLPWFVSQWHLCAEGSSHCIAWRVLGGMMLSHDERIRVGTFSLYIFKAEPLLVENN